VLALGDLAYERGAVSEFADCFHESWGQHVKSILPVPGNHEYGSTDAAPYFAYFEKHGRTIVLQNSPKEGPNAGYYSLNFPGDDGIAPRSGIRPWRLIALNSKKGKPPPEQMGWLKKELNTNDHRCVLAFAHFFAFSSGRHGHEPPDFQRADEANSQKDLQADPNMVDIFQALYASGASLLLSGHDHSYEQFRRQDAMGNLDSNGLRSFVVGTGGAPFYREVYKNTWLNSEKEKRQARWHGILKLELFETRYRWRFVPIDMVANQVPANLKAPSEEDCNVRKGPIQ